MSIQRYIADPDDLVLVDRPDTQPEPDDNVVVLYADHVAAIEAAERGHRYECRLSEEGHDVSLDGMRCIDCEAECICGYLNGLRKERRRSVLLIADAYGKGREQAIRNCIEAVKALPHSFQNTPQQWVEVPRVDILAALRALLDGAE